MYKIPLGGGGSIASSMPRVVKVLSIHRYSVDIFSYPGPSGILGSDGKHNTA